MKQDLGLNPWLSIWVKPRKTIRALIDFNVNYRFIVLCAIYGFQYMLQAAQFASLWLTLLVSIVLAIPVGYVAFNVWSFFLFLLGKLVKGKGQFKQVRAATCWTSIPIVVGGLIWIVLMVVHGNSFFVAEYERGVTTINTTLIVAASIQAITAIWGLVIFLHALGEVQGFSAWMALLNTFLALLAIFILLFLASWGVSAMTHAT